MLTLWDKDNNEVPLGGGTNTIIDAEFEITATELKLSLIIEESTIVVDPREFDPNATLPQGTSNTKKKLKAMKKK